MPTMPHSLLPLLPQFLGKRRRGFAGLAALVATSGLSRPAFFLLLRVAEHGPAGASADELRPGAPYATRDPHRPWLDEATAGGFLARDEAGHYRLTAQGAEAVAGLERGATAYLATLRPLPEEELAALADDLDEVATGLDDAAGGPKAHLARARRVAALAPEADAAPLVRIERAIFALWMARDDAHIASWRVARFPPVLLAILTALWHGDADTVEELQALLAETQDAADVAAHIEELLEQGYVEWKQGLLQPTRAGYNVRETIEGDTDDHYFHQWPPLDPAAIARLHDTLSRLIAALPDAPPPPAE